MDDATGWILSRNLCAIPCEVKKNAFVVEIDVIHLVCEWETNQDHKLFLLYGENLDSVSSSAFDAVFFRDWLSSLAGWSSCYMRKILMKQKQNCESLHLNVSFSSFVIQKLCRLFWAPKYTCTEFAQYMQKCIIKFTSWICISLSFLSRICTECLFLGSSFSRMLIYRLYFYQVLYL